MLAGRHEFRHVDINWSGQNISRREINRKRLLAADAKATALAGVESVLKTYQAILQQKPDAKAKALDDLLKKQSQGKLKDSVQKQCQ